MSVTAAAAETPDVARIEKGDSPPPAAGTVAGTTRSPHLGAYWDIMRPHNIPSSFGLVAAGALVASHTVGSMLDPKVGVQTQNFPNSEIHLLLARLSAGVVRYFGC